MLDPFPESDTNAQQRYAGAPINPVITLPEWVELKKEKRKRKTKNKNKKKTEERRKKKEEEGDEANRKKKKEEITPQTPLINTNGRG